MAMDSEQFLGAVEQAWKSTEHHCQQPAPSTYFQPILHNAEQHHSISTSGTVFCLDFSLKITKSILQTKTNWQAARACPRAG